MKFNLKWFQPRLIHKYYPLSLSRNNPLSPNSVQQQFSPNSIHSLSRDKVMRINKMIIIEKIL